MKFTSQSLLVSLTHMAHIYAIELAFANNSTATGNSTMTNLGQEVEDLNAESYIAIAFISAVIYDFG